MGRGKRVINTGFDTCLIGFGGRDYVKSYSFDPSTLVPGGVDEVQTLTVTGSPTGGTFKLTLGAYQTGAIAYNATGATVQAALRALNNVGSNGVTVTGGAGGPWVVTFSNGLGKRDVRTLVVDGSLLTGGTSPAVTVAETTKGDASYSGLYVITSGLIIAKTSDGKYAQEYLGTGNLAEVQTVTISGTPTGGTFVLVFDGEQTAPIAYNAVAGTVQTALEGLPNIDPGDVVVSGGPGPGTPYVVTFAGQYDAQSVPLLVPGSALTGGTNPTTTVAQTTQGGSTQVIEGIFDGYWDFLEPTRAAAKQIPVYGRNATFDIRRIPKYTTWRGELLRWASTVDATFQTPNN